MTISQYTYIVRVKIRIMCDIDEHIYNIQNVPTLHYKFIYRY